MSTVSVAQREIYRVQVLDRVFSIIDALEEESSGMTLPELSKRLRLHKSTLHRLVMLLEDSRYIEKIPPGGKYRLGPKLLELGMKVAARLDFAAVARPFLQRLVKETGETAHLGVLIDGVVISMTNVVSSRSLQAPSTVGRQTPAHTSSLGKSQLASLPEEELADFLARHKLTRYTTRTITELKDLKAELQRVRERGYAVDDEEYEEGLKCLGAPVRDHTGNVVAALAIAGPATRLGETRMPVLTGSVMRAAAGLSAALGYQAARSPARGFGAQQFQTGAERT